jgi:hypothetical protein
VPGRLRGLPDGASSLSRAGLAEHGKDPAQLGSRIGVGSQEPQQPGLPLPCDGQSDRFIRSRDLDMRPVKLLLGGVGQFRPEPSP